MKRSLLSCSLVFVISLPMFAGETPPNTLLGTSTEYQEWSSSIFNKLPELELINERSVDFSAGGQPINSEDKKAMKGYEGGRYFIVMDLAFTIEKDSSGVFVSVESPDSFVYLYDSKRKRIHMISHVG